MLGSALPLSVRLRRVRLLTAVGSVERACPAEGTDGRTRRCPEPSDPSPHTSPQRCWENELLEPFSLLGHLWVGVCSLGVRSWGNLRSARLGLQAVG